MTALQQLQGYKTLIVAVLVALIGGVCGHYGLVVSQSDQLAVASAAFAGIMIVMRHVSVGMAGWRIPKSGVGDPAYLLLTELVAELQAKQVIDTATVIGAPTQAATHGAGWPAPPV